MRERDSGYLAKVASLVGTIVCITFFLVMSALSMASGLRPSPSGMDMASVRAPQITPTPCTAGAWSEKSPYPTAIAENAVASQGGLVYSFGGIINNVSVANAYKYDPTSDAWTSIAPLPGARSEASAVSDGTYIYIVGGADQNFNASSTIWRYDPSANSYNTSLSSYTIPTYGQAAAYLNGKIYRIAGASTGSDFHVEVYTIATNSWAMAANYPFANHDLMAVGLGSYVYAGGGNASPSTTYRYDPNTDSWDDSAIADFPQGRQGSASGVYNGRWLLAGGDVNFATSANVIAWDPGSNTWSTLPDMSQARSYLAGASTGGSFYAVGGWSSPGVGTTDTQRYQESACGTATPNPTATSTPAATSTPTPGCVSGWSIVPSPNTGTADNRLFAVGAVASNGVWAVGWSSDGTNQQTLTEHWNGTQWTIVPSPSLGPIFNELLGVAAIASNNVWAVGWHSSLEHTLVEHWDGTQWTVVPSADPLSYNILSAVSARTASDIWAAGWSSNGSTHQTLVEHYDGSTWTAVPSPNLGTSDDRLFGVTAVAANDVWAVGRSYNGTVFQTLTEHWDGTSFTIVPSPNGPSNDSYLSAVAAVAANDVWAVDRYGPTGAWQTLTEHWNGTQWSVVPSPDLGSPSVLDSVTAIGPNDVWAVGGWSQTLALHWDGTQWSIVPSPNAGASSILQGVTALSTTNVWSVGYSYDNSSSHTLIEHYVGQCATATATATHAVTSTATSTPQMPTSTSTPTSAQTSTLAPTANGTSISTGTNTPAVTATPRGPTSTGVPTGTATPTTRPAATPTACLLQFSDVPPGSTFYPFVRCLACLGIINGYPDGTFRPGNNVTRGQLSKIVSNSAGFNDPQTTQLFEDVPPDSTFFDHVGRLASRGFMSGYPCGGAGEPCVPPDNLPYFRPNNNATRGQISKIVSNAAGFGDTPSGQQFQDVPAGSTYYTYTFRLVTRSIMAGYPCGGAGEPCVPPGNLPYFRPNNNATRGQTSKIVSNTFFPDCNPPRR
jgi:N-acetylneuraminic acid mutarotase